MQQVIAERERVASEIARRKRALDSFIAEFPDSVELAKNRIKDFPDLGGLSHKKSWVLFINASVEDRKSFLNADTVNGLHWQALLQFSPFFTDERWKKHLEGVE